MNYYSLGVCVVYYYIYVVLLPKWGGYQLRQDILQSKDGEVAHRLVKVPDEQVAAWDAEHDAGGHLRQRRAATFAI